MRLLGEGEKEEQKSKSVLNRELENELLNVPRRPGLPGPLVDGQNSAFIAQPRL